MKSIQQLDNIEDKIVLLRLDLNVPIFKGKITDTNRVDKIIPTLKFLISKKALKHLNFKAINFHPGLLPEYKGCFSTPWSLINNEREVGYTYHFINEKFDCGNILLKESIKIEKNDDAFSLNFKIFQKGLSRLGYVIDRSKSNGVPQAKKGKYYANEIPFNGEIDMIVSGVGTGGTITGIAKYLKQKNPEIKIIGADPFGSILGGGNEVFPYKVEGIGYDFFPDVLDNSLIDKYVKVNDEDSFDIARQLIKKEGLLCGGSSGTVVWAALKEAKSLKKGQKCLCILADGIRNYMSKFVSDEWMKKNNFKI